MQIALIADLHGNWPATEALQRDIARRGIDTIYCLGDMIGKGPDSARTMDWAMANCEIALAGNWDTGVVGDDSPTAKYFLDQIGARRAEIIRALPLEHTLELSGRKIRLFHGRWVTDDLLWLGADEKTAARYFKANGETYDVVGYADIHRQGMVELDGVGFLFNTGSIGNQLGGLLKACYAILTGEPDDANAPLDIAFISLAYDRAQAIRDALARPDLPRQDAYIREIETGYYGRG